MSLSDKSNVRALPGVLVDAPPKTDLRATLNARWRALEAQAEQIAALEEEIAALRSELERRRRRRRWWRR